MDTVLNSNYKSYQFELWEECNSHCSFCYLGNNNLATSNQQKLANLNQTIEKIQDDTLYSNIDCLAYIGGEFFQGQLNDPAVHTAFMHLMELTNQKLESKKIKVTWISASLLIGDQADMFEALSKFTDLSKVWILTSYDTIGRFHSQKQKEHWLSLLKKIKQLDNRININITAIVTGDLIDRYLDGDFELKKISQENGCSFFLKPACQVGNLTSRLKTNDLIPNFFPTRQQILKFLAKYKTQENAYDYDKLFNIGYRADYMQTFGHRYHFTQRLKGDYAETFDDATLQTMPCGHSYQYQCYLDSDKCLICDKMSMNW